MAFCTFFGGRMSANAATLEHNANSVYSIRANQADEYINKESVDSSEMAESGEIEPLVISATPGSLCVGSGCIGSICLGSACTSTTCLGSACIGSTCIISGCVFSSCLLCP